MLTMRDLLAKSRRVLLFDRLEDYEVAISMLTEYLSREPQNGIAYNNRGPAHAEIGQGDEALRDFARAMECSPADPMPYMNRGGLYLRAKPAARLQEAIDDFTQAIVLDGSDATFHRCRAHACLKANRLQDAIDSFSNAIRLEPDFRQTYVERGETYRRLGEDDRVEEDFDTASKMGAAGDLLEVRGAGGARCLPRPWDCTYSQSQYSGPICRS
jgi:tetratricopeptide (TPR) repeat protein